MEKKEEIIKVTSPVEYLKFLLDSNLKVEIFFYDPIKKEEIDSLIRIETLSVSLFQNQFSVDTNKSCLFFSSETIGKYVKIKYYSEGQLNPFYTASNLHVFIEKVLKWTSNRIIDGLFFYSYLTDDNKLLRFKEGSFTYNNNFYVFGGDTFRLSDNAPPTTIGEIKGYLFFFNKEIVESFTEKATSQIFKTGMLISSSGLKKMEEVTLDLKKKYGSKYSSQILEIAKIYVSLNSERKYNIWTHYDRDSRSL